MAPIRIYHPEIKLFQKQKGKIKCVDIPTKPKFQSGVRRANFSSAAADRAVLKPGHGKALAPSRRPVRPCAQVQLRKHQARGRGAFSSSSESSIQSRHQAPRAPCIAPSTPKSRQPVSLVSWFS